MSIFGVRFGFIAPMHTIQTCVRIVSAPMRWSSRDKSFLYCNEARSRLLGYLPLKYYLVANLIGHSYLVDFAFWV